MTTELDRFWDSIQDLFYEKYGEHKLGRYQFNHTKDTDYIDDRLQSQHTKLVDAIQNIIDSQSHNIDAGYYKDSDRDWWNMFIGKLQNLLKESEK